MHEKLKYDNPLLNPHEDVLGRAHFSEALAKSIIGLEASHGFVYGLYGPWGSGKSTIINFVEHFVQQHNNKKDVESKVVIFKFNPWMFSGSENLTRVYLDQLRIRLSMSDVSKDLQAISKGIEFIERGLTFAGPIADTVLPGFGGFFKSARETLSNIRGAADSVSDTLKQDLHHARQTISERLNNQKDKILVVIDDLDRLFDEELKDFIKMIKAVCDFPKIVYLVACDSDKIAKALDHGNDAGGYDYLEKIVQCSFNVPRPDQQSLNKLFFQDMDNILFPVKNAELLFDETDWGNLFHDGIAPRLETPRNVKSLVNSIAACYPAVKGEANITDFVGVQGLRVFYPRAYALIEQNKELLTGSTDYNAGGGEKEARESFYKELDAQVLQRDMEDFRNLMSRIFPKYAQLVSRGMGYGGDWNSRWKQRRKVCSADCFDLYFSLSIPRNSFSLQGMMEIIDLAGDQNALKERLHVFIRADEKEKSGRYQAFLTELENYTEETVPKDKIESFLQVIYDLSDEVSDDDEYRSFLDFGVDMAMLRISYQLIMRFENEEDRFKILKNVFDKTTSISLMVHEASLLEQKDQKEKNDTVNLEHSKILIACALDRIRKDAKNHRFNKSHQLAYIAYRWRDWAPESEVKGYIAELIKTDEGLIDFLTGFLSMSMSHGMSDRVVKKTYRVPHKSVLYFVGDELLERLISRARQIASNPSGLNDRSKRAVTAFLEEKDNPNKYRD